MKDDASDAKRRLVFDKSALTALFGVHTDIEPEPTDKESRAAKASEESPRLEDRSVEAEPPPEQNWLLSVEREWIKSTRSPGARTTNVLLQEATMAL